MTTYTKEQVPSAGGTVDILVEVEEAAPNLPRTYHDYGLLRGSPVGEQPKKAFQSGMSLVRACAEQIADTVGAIEQRLRPETVAVELGVKLDGEVGALIARSGVEGHLKVTLTWERRHDE